MLKTKGKCKLVRMLCVQIGEVVVTVAVGISGIRS